MVHDFVVHGRGTRPLAPGQSQVLHIPDVAAGEYRMWCDMPNHAAAGSGWNTRRQGSAAENDGVCVGKCRAASLAREDAPTHSVRPRPGVCAGSLLTSPTQRGCGWQASGS
jgi:hypothetical protein